MFRTIGFAAFVTMLAAALPLFAQDKPILAVMEIEDKTGKFERKDLEAATEYLSTLLIASGKYSVVEKGRQEAKRKQVVKDLKRETHDACYDDKCRIELGRALAADTLLSCSILGMGKSCTLTCRMVPLEKEISDLAAVSDFDCTADLLPGVVRSAVSGLTKPPTAKVAHDQRRATEGIVNDVGVEWIWSKAASLFFARTETTVRQYQACIEAGGCDSSHHNSSTRDRRCNMGQSGRLDHPMNCVAWHGAVQFCDWAEGRLPSEGEWYLEASNRGSYDYPWGKIPVTCDSAVWGEYWCGSSSPTGCTTGCGKNGTWPVCSRTAGNSVSGLCDMSGNVWEWTGTSIDGKRVLRGGSFSNRSENFLRAQATGKQKPDRIWSGGGFRCVRAGGR